MDEYYRSEKFKKLLSRYESFRNGEHGVAILDSEEIIDVAEFYYAIRNISEAVEAADLALAIYPGATTPLAFKARLAANDEKDYHKALDIIEMVADKSDIEYSYAKAEIALANNDVESADKLLEERFNDCDEFDNEECQDIILEIAEIYADYDRMDRCRKWLGKAEDTESSFYKELMAKVYISEGRFKEAETLINNLIDDNPYNIAYWNKLAFVYFACNNIQESMTASEYALAINKEDEDALLNKAICLYYLGNYEDSLAYYKKYNETAPWSDIGYIYLAMMCMYFGDINKSVELYKIALEKAKERHASENIRTACHELALIHGKRGEFNTADYYLDELVKAGAPEALRKALKGTIYLFNKMTSEAFEMFRKATIESNKDSDVLLTIGIALYDNLKLSNAYSVFRYIVENNGERGRIAIPYLARCCFDLDKKEEYKKYLRMSLSYSPTETFTILSELYPNGTSPEDYLNIEPVLPTK